MKKVTKVYIAGPFFNEYQLDQIKRIEEHLDMHNIPYFSPRLEGVLDEMEHDEKMSSRERIFRSNVDSIDDCSHMIGCIEGRDTGTLFEVGVAYQQKMDLVLYVPDISNVSVMLSEASKCVCTNISYLRFALDGSHNEYDQIEGTH